MSSLNIIGNFQDVLNTSEGENRKFVFNAGEFDAKRGLWTIDLLEIIPAVPIGYNYLATPTDDLILTDSGDNIIL